MKGKALQLTDFNKGDVLLFEDVTGAASHTAIAVGQSIFSHRSGGSSNVTHAGIADTAGNIYEASGAAGLRSMQLVDKHHGYKFQVYRCSSIWIASIALDWAQKLLAEVSKTDGFGFYDTKGAGTGMFSSSKRGSGAVAAVGKLIEDPYAMRGFYCSNFVVECYELAADTTESCSGNRCRLS